MSAKLKAWLRKLPQPVAVICDGKRVEVPQTGRPWIELCTTITALNPTKLEAIDKAGATLRAMERDASEEGETAAPSPELSDLQHFGKLLSEAYNASSKSYGPLLDSAMTFIAHQTTQINAQAREIERLRTVTHKQQAKIIELSGMQAPPDAEGEPNILTGLLAGIAQAAAGGGAIVPAPAQNAPTPKPRKAAPNGAPT